MNLFGRFLELSTPVRDIRESLEWYRLLGFHECAVGDIYHYHYAVVTDGRVFIGLHSADIEEISLTFVRPELNLHFRELQALGLDVNDVYQGDEHFHQLVLHDPTGLQVRLIEARTFSPSAEGQTPLTGQIRNIGISARCLDDARDFWQHGGFSAHDDHESIELLSPGMTLQLQAGAAAPQLNFLCPNKQALIKLLMKEELRYQQHGELISLTSPEGLQLSILG